jgi:hypothetical protein
MDSTHLLAKAIGPFLVIVGAAIMLRRDYFIEVFGAYPRERLTRVVVSLAELLAGLFLVVAHNVWSPLPAAILTIIGWMAVIEGLVYLLLPDAGVGRFIGTFNTPGWYVAGGVLAIVVGAYLAAFGFGLI